MKPKNTTSMQGKCELHSDKMENEYGIANQPLNHDLDRINHLVTEWLLLTRKNNPETKIDAQVLQAKALEIAKVFQMQLFEIKYEFRWIRIFEQYLHSRGIKCWKPSDECSALMSKEEPHLDECKSVIFEESSASTAARGSIQSYKEALKRVEILQRYCKAIQNKNALELTGRLQKILRKKI